MTDSALFTMAIMFHPAFVFVAFCFIWVVGGAAVLLGKGIYDIFVDPNKPKKVRIRSAHWYRSSEW